MSEKWRVGSHYGIHVYKEEIPVATFHTVEDAVLAVKLVNEYYEKLQTLQGGQGISDFSFECLICGYEELSATSSKRCPKCGAQGYISRRVPNQGSSR